MKRLKFGLTHRVIIKNLNGSREPEKFTAFFDFREKKMNLKEFRNEIDSIDGQIVELLNRRAEAARKIGLIKAKAGLPIIDRLREVEILRRISHENAGPIEESALARIYGEILLESRRLQSESIANLTVDTEVWK